MLFWWAVELVLWLANKECDLEVVGLNPAYCLGLFSINRNNFISCEGATVVLALRSNGSTRDLIVLGLDTPLQREQQKVGKPRPN